MSDKRLQGKVAVITGAGAKFGQAITLGYAAEGADLFLQDFSRNAEKLAAIADKAGASGGRVVTATCDITRGSETAAMAQQVIRDFGRVDVLVNTAADGAHGVFFDIPEDEFDRAIAAGLKSYFLTCQYIGKEMARAGSGSIINLTSIVGQLGSGGAAPWSATRGGVDAMTRAIAHALGLYGIRVNALAHGGTESNSYTPEARAERLRRLPFGRLGVEEDMVGPAIFLATPDAEWVHGTVLYADGGYTAAAVTDAEHRPESVPYRGA